MTMTPPLAALALLLAAAAPAMAQDAQALAQENFVQADADGSGDLTREELVQLISLNAEDDLGNARRAKRMGMESRAFDRVDANGDDHVSRDEIRAMARR